MGEVITLALPKTARCEACKAEHFEEGYLCATCEKTCGRQMHHETTVDQIGRITLGAIGARDYRRDYDRLSFTISRGHRRVEVKLDLNDTYRVVTRMIRSGKTVYAVDGIYCEQLGEAVWQAHIER